MNIGHRTVGCRVIQPVIIRNGIPERILMRGILLTERQMLDQYDRYNKSAELDVETQDILSAILDTMEAQAKRKK